MLQSSPVNVQHHDENIPQGNITQIVLPKLCPLAFSIIRGSKYQSQQRRTEQTVQSESSQNELNQQPIEQKIKLAQRQNLQEFVDVPYQEFMRKCLTVNHKDASILEFCSNKKCKQQSRYLCEFCIKDGLHKSDLKQKQQIILKQYQVNEKIKENYNSLEGIYKINTKVVDYILLICKTQVERLYSNIAKLANDTQFNQLLYRIKQLGQILGGEQKISSIDGDLLYKLITEQPENFLYKEFGDIINGFKQIQKDIDSFNQTSLEISKVIEELMKVKKNVQLYEKSTEEIIEEARSFIQSGQQEQQIEMLIDHLEEDRSKLKECEIRNTIGYGFYKQASYDQAICQFEKAIQISDKQGFQAQNYKYYYYIGKSQFKSYLTYKFEIQTEERQVICEYFLQNFNQSKWLNPKFVSTYIQISKIYGDLGQTENRQINQLKVYKLMIMIINQPLNQGNYILIQINLKKLINIQKKPLNQNNSIQRQLNQNQNLKNLIHYLRKVNITENNYIKKSYSLSFGSLQGVTKYNPYNEDAHYFIAICLYKMGDIDKALNILQQLAQKNKFDRRYEKLIDQILMPQG